MSKESLDYSILCPNYYTNWEEGCCMENCTLNDLDLCPIHYVKGLLEYKDQQIKILQKALELACKELRDISCMTCNSCNRFEMCDYVLSTYPESYFIEEAKEMVENE